MSISKYKGFKVVTYPSRHSTGKRVVVIDKFNNPVFDKEFINDDIALTNGKDWIDFVGERKYKKPFKHPL